MTTSPRPLRIGNVSASRTDRSSATAEFLAAASLDVLALDMLSDEAMLDLAEQRAAGGPGYERAALVQIGECLDRLGAGGAGGGSTLTWWGGGLLLLGAGSTWLVRRNLRPLERVAATATRVSTRCCNAASVARRSPISPEPVPTLSRSC